ncbi:GGDEF domain-containing protein [Devosia submarina]|uniref:GGDEF domain-containing protein n=1 Tax=Devosia submarina TaxID=1173082 RepID=UPI000D366E9D|nr:GGDEF domain-containing protein [Devosia submarina]
MKSSTVVPIGLKTRLDDRMKVALNAMPVAISWSRIDDDVVEFMNRRFTDVTGYTLAEAGTVADLIRRLFANRQQANHAVVQLNRLRGQNLLEPFEFPQEEVPIVTRAGKLLPTRFSGVMLPEANMSLAMFQYISAEKEREERLQAIAGQDPLTGLYNRRAFDAAFAEALNMSRHQETVGLIVMDLDGLKPVNDTHGHSAGDAVLRHFADLLRSTFRSSDLVARWGGDEFAVLIRHPCSRTNVAVALSRLEKAVAKPITIGDGQVSVGVSSGIAFYPDDAQNLSELYRIADDAMYSAKRRKRNAMRT